MTTVAVEAVFLVLISSCTPRGYVTSLRTAHYYYAININQIKLEKLAFSHFQLYIYHTSNKQLL